MTCCIESILVWMAAGDIRGAAMRLRSALLGVTYPATPSIAALQNADSRVLLDILRFALTSFSPHVAVWAADSLLVRSDAQFLPAAFRLIVNRLALKVPMTCAQFHSVGFVERKLLFVADVLRAVRHAHEERETQARLQVAFTKPYRTYVARSGPCLCWVPTYRASNASLPPPASFTSTHPWRRRMQP